MRENRGSFLLQALMGVALIAAFMPFFANKFASRERNIQMTSVVNQIDAGVTAARIFMRENNGVYQTYSLSGNRFADVLENYGLPFGFYERTVFDQSISFQIKQGIGYVIISGGDLKPILMSEMARRINSDAVVQGDQIIVKIPTSDVFSEIVKKNEKNPDLNAFFSDLDMGDFGISNIGKITAKNLQLGGIATNKLTVNGIQDLPKKKNDIAVLNTKRATFSSRYGESALSITGGNLTADTMSAQTISKFGNAGNLTANTINILGYSMPAGRGSFAGPATWRIADNFIANNVSFQTEQLDIMSSLNTLRGQDVYVDDYGYITESNSGVSAGIVRAGNITIYDQIGPVLESGGSGNVVLDIRVAGTSIIPDVYLSELNTSGFKMIAVPEDDGDATQSCEALIKILGGNYNSKSLAHSIICQYVFWQRLEKRIDILYEG